MCSLVLDDSMPVQSNLSTQLFKSRNPDVCIRIPNEILCFKELNVFLGDAF
jgi:hypothetical protein